MATGRQRVEKRGQGRLGGDYDIGGRGREIQVSTNLALSSEPVPRGGGERPPAHPGETETDGNVPVHILMCISWRLALLMVVGQAVVLWTSLRATTVSVNPWNPSDKALFRIYL